MGLDAAQPFSKIKLPARPWNKTSAPGTTQKQKLNPNIQALKTVASRLGRLNWRSRLVAHATFIGVAALVVMASTNGSSATQVASLLDHQGGYGSVLDPVAAADVAATVADRTDSLVANEASQNATTASSQINLPLADDDYLAKRQVVATVGNANRGLITHKVAPGDTVAGLASKFNITTDTIKWANNLQSDAVSVGQKLIVPPITGVVHKVVAGETPELLARRYQANAAQIVSFNNAEVKGLQPGQSVVIPDGVIPQVSRPVTKVASKSGASSLLPRYSFRGNGYAYGYCTYYVAGRRAIPNGWGDARSWYYNAQFSGFKVGRTPAVGAIAWTSRGYYGHVSYVEQVNGNMVLVSEMNYNGSWNRVTSRWVPYTEFGGYIY